MDLDDVYEAIREDERWAHLRFPGVDLVPGYGNADDPIAMVVGTAPGARDSLKRRPFTGEKGRILFQLMGLAGLSATGDACAGCDTPHAQYDCPHREDIRPNTFVTNLVKYRLPGSREPGGREVFDATEALRQEWKAIGRPLLIVTLGVAAYAFAKNDFTPRPGEWKALLDGKTFVWFQHDPRTAQNEEDQEIVEGHWEAMGKWLREL